MSTQKRIVDIFIALLENRPLSTKDISETYQISQRSAQRDIKVVKDALDDFYLEKKINYDPTTSRYSLDHIGGIESKFIYLLLKILLASRVLAHPEIDSLMNELLALAPENDRAMINDSIRNEFTFMTTLKDKQPRAKKTWQLEKLIADGRLIRFDYLNYEATEKPVNQKVIMRPTSIFFDNYYLFLVSLESVTKKYVIYRIDWVKNIHQLSEQLEIKYGFRYEEGLKRPIMAYAYSGQKTRIQFEYYGFVDYVIDQFPSCKIIKKLDKKNQYPFSVYLLQIDVEYSAGVRLWLLGQSGILRVVSPASVANDIKEILRTSYQRYQE